MLENFSNAIRCYLGRHPKAKVILGIFAIILFLIVMGLVGAEDYKHYCMMYGL